MALRDGLRTFRDQSLQLLSSQNRSKQPILLWNQQDQEANTLCNTLLCSFGSLCISCPAESSKLEHELEQLIFKQAQGAVTCPGGVLLVWVCGDSAYLPSFPNEPDILDKYRKSISITCELCYLTAEDMVPRADQFNRIWLVQPQNVNSPDSLASILLMGADEVSANDSRVVRLETQIFNSMEYYAAFNLRNRLQYALEGAPAQDEQQFRERLGPDKDSSHRILSKTPCITSLPAVGWEELQSKLGYSVPAPSGGNLLRRMIHLLFSDDTTSASSASNLDASVDEVMDILFGKLDSKNVFDWCCSHETDALARLCKGQLKEDSIIRELERLPLKFIIGKALEIAQKEYEQAKEAQNKALSLLNQVRKKTLQTQLQYGSVMNALSAMLDSTWQQWLNASLNMEWWSTINRTLNDNKLRSKALQKYNAIDSSIRILETLHLPPVQSPESSLVDWNTLDPDSVPDGINGQSQFAPANLVNLLKQICSEDDKRVNADGKSQTLLLWDSSASTMDRLRACSTLNDPIFSSNSTDGTLQLICSSKIFVQPVDHLDNICDSLWWVHTHGLSEKAEVKQHDS